MVRPALALAIALSAPPAHADAVEDAEAETRAALALAEDGIEVCFPPFTGEAEAHLVASYRGGEPVEGVSAPFPTRAVTVRVEPTEAPVLLILNGFEPIVWRIEAAPEARIAGAYLNGAFVQRVTGLPEGVAVGRTHRQDGIRGLVPPCASAAEAEGRDDARSLERRAGEIAARITELRRPLDAERERARFVKAHVDALREAAALAEGGSRSRIEERLRLASEVPVLDRARRMALNDEIRDLTREAATLRREALVHGFAPRVLSEGRVGFFDEPRSIERLRAALADELGVPLVSEQLGDGGPLTVPPAE